MKKWNYVDICKKLIDNNYTRHLSDYMGAYRGPDNDEASNIKYYTTCIVRGFGECSTLNCEDFQLVGDVEPEKIAILTTELNKVGNHFVTHYSSALYVMSSIIDPVFFELREKWKTIQQLLLDYGGKLEPSNDVTQAVKEYIEKLQEILSSVEKEAEDH